MVPITLFNIGITINFFVVSLTYEPEATTKIHFYLFGVIEMGVHYSLLIDPRFLVNAVTLLIIMIL